MSVRSAHRSHVARYTQTTHCYPVHDAQSPSISIHSRLPGVAGCSHIHMRARVPTRTAHEAERARGFLCAFWLGVCVPCVAATESAAHAELAVGTHKACSGDTQNAHHPMTHTVPHSNRCRQRLGNAPSRSSCVPEPSVGASSLDRAHTRAAVTTRQRGHACA